MKNKIIYLALEPIESRYGIMVNEAIAPFADHVIMPSSAEYSRIENGEFLDVSRTITFKAEQLRIVSEMFTRGEIEEGTVFVVADIFFPGIESLRYMSDLLKIKIHMVGFNYAGRADKHDFVQQLGNWSDTSEAGYHKCFDAVFVGSQDHQRHVERKFGHSNVFETGYVWDTKYLDRYMDKLESAPDEFCIWPHRISKEKGFDFFLRIAERMPCQRFVITSCGKAFDLEKAGIKFLPENVSYRPELTKKEYYEYLSSARYYLSTAKQETFGYTLQEAIYFGCRIAVPNAACYAEMVPPDRIYHPGNLDNAVKQIQASWELGRVPDYWTRRFDKNFPFRIMPVIEQIVHGSKHENEVSCGTSCCDDIRIERNICRAY